MELALSRRILCIRNCTLRYVRQQPTVSFILRHKYNVQDSIYKKWIRIRFRNSESKSKSQLQSQQNSVSVTSLLSQKVRVVNSPAIIMACHAMPCHPPTSTCNINISFHFLSFSSLVHFTFLSSENYSLSFTTWEREKGKVNEETNFTTYSNSNPLWLYQVSHTLDLHHCSVHCRQNLIWKNNAYIWSKGLFLAAN